MCRVIYICADIMMNCYLCGESSHPDYKDEDISFDISSSFIHTDKICTFILSFL